MELVPKNFDIIVDLMILIYLLERKVILIILIIKMTMKLYIAQEELIIQIIIIMLNLRKIKIYIE